MATSIEQLQAKRDELVQALGVAGIRTGEDLDSIRRHREGAPAHRSRNRAAAVFDQPPDRRRLQQWDVTIEPN